MIQTNECTQFHSSNTTTTQQLLHVSGLTGPSSGSTQFYKRDALCFLQVVHLLVQIVILNCNAQNGECEIMH